MSPMSPAERAADAALAARLLAVDPHGLGGAALRALPGPARDAWLACFRAALPADEPLRRLPMSAGEDALLGGLDLAATLKAGRPVARGGLLAGAHGGALVVPSAERIEAGIAALLGAALDAGAVQVEREGIAALLPARIAVVAIDEGDADERPPDALRDRLAFGVDLAGLSLADLGAFASLDPNETAEARERLARIEIGDENVRALCGTAMALGIASLRAPILALAAAKASAALQGRDGIHEDDLAAAARLVLAPRATQLPSPAQDDQPSDPPPAPPADGDEPQGPSPEGDPSDRLVEAAAAALPPDLLARCQAAVRGGKAARARGEAGAVKRRGGIGRPAGTRRGDPRAGARLDLVATLRTAAPWQPVRRREGADPSRIAVRREDFRVALRKPRTRATAIFVVDASGSAALNRLAEAKGAIELLLAEAYIRRDRVALIAFRGRAAELLLEPTRSLARAKRMLAALPGGGATPLAAGIEAGSLLGDSLRRRGDAPTLVLLTDGGANVARGGGTGRAPGGEDALAAARKAGAEGLSSLVLDISPRGQPLAREVAEALRARYVPLPRADAAAMSTIVRSAMI